MMKAKSSLTLAGWLLLAASGLARPAPAQEPTERAPVAAWPRFAAAFEGELQPRFDRRSGELVQALGRARVSPVGIAEADLEISAREVLREARELLGVEPGSFRESYRTHTGGLLVWQAEQRIQDLPVVGSRVECIFHQDGHLLSLRAHGLLPGPAEPIEFRVSRRDAGELARVMAPGAIWRTYAWEPTRLVVPESVDGRLEARAAWRLRVADPAAAEGLWTVYVDARTGEVFRIDSEVIGALVLGSVDGRGIPAKTHQTGGPPVVAPMAFLYVNGFLPGSGIIYPTALNGCDEETPQVSGDGLKIAYVSGCGGDREIWVMSADGSAQTQLTTNGVDDHSPSTDEAGDTIVFVSELTGNPEIWKIASDGTGLTQLTANGATNLRPSLADAADELIFASDLDGDFEIYRLGIDGTGLAQLTSNSAWDGQADLSGDGSKVAFVSDRDGDLEVFSMDSDGSDETQLTFNAVDDGAPSIDDLGGLIAFESMMEAEYGAPGGIPAGISVLGRRRSYRRVPAHFSLWEIGADGAGLQPLLHDSGTVSGTDLSGDGSTVVFAYRANAAVDAEIYVLHRSTSTIVSLTDNDLEDTRPSVSDDGKAIAWENEDGERSIAIALLLPGTFARTVTDAAGGYGLDFPAGSSPSISARLSGLYARVVDKAPGFPDLRVGTSATAPSAGVDMLFNPTGAAELPTSQVTAYQHAELAHFNAASILSLPSFALGLPLPIDVPVLLRVNDPTGARNAFYSPLTKAMTFFVGTGPGRPNTAYDTVIYHEYGHFMDDMFGGFVDLDPCAHLHAQSEGLGDVHAISTSGSLVVGEDFDGAGTAIRDYAFPNFLGGSGTRQYDCLDCATEAGTGLPEPHDHGEALAGFYKDLRGLLGAAVADELMYAFFSTNPPDMNSGVLGLFLRDADPLIGYGGTGDPALAPHYDELCEAAARHGFDCWPRTDWGSEVCWLPVCTASPPGVHHTTSTEWLGATVSGFDGGCDPIPDPFDEDGVLMPPGWPAGGAVPVTVTVSVDPALLGSERYGGLTAAGEPNPLRFLYLNAWLVIDDAMGGISEIHHVLGTGSTSPDPGPQGFPPNTIAFDPEAWLGSSTTTATFTVEVPDIPEDRYGYVRFRLDYGEDAGLLTPMNCLSDPALAGPCGPARYGEVEDYQVFIDVP